MTRSAYEVLHVRADAPHVVIQAAYRALAVLYHPDRDATARAARLMIELNDAYQKVRAPDRRSAYDRSLRRASAYDVPPVTHPSGNSWDRPRSASPIASLDFGRYAGWRLDQVARTDPDYLRWLRRHSSGIRFRGEIDALLTEPSSSWAQAGRHRG